VVSSGAAQGWRITYDSAFPVAGLWQERVENRDNPISREVTKCKTVDFDRGCNSIQNQLVRFVGLLIKAGPEPAGNWSFN
jgi:hypothetical protein